MAELLDRLASAVPIDTEAGKCKATHLFFGDVVRLFPFPKTSPVSSSKKLISIQRCRRLWGSFGLASYFTLNAIYWIMNLLCSSDRVNSVNSLSVHPPKKQAFKVTLWSWMKFKWKFSPCQRESTGSRMALCCLVKILVKSRGCQYPYKEDEEAVVHCATAWVCVDMLLNMKSKKIHE